MSFEQNYPLISAAASVTNGAPSVAAIAAPGAGRKNVIAWGVLTISLAATGGGGVVSLKDGSTVLCSFPAAAVNVFYVQLGDNGYYMSANSALNLVAESAVTNQASAQLLITGYIVG